MGGGCTSAAIVGELNCQCRVAKLMGGIIDMTTGVVAAEVGLVVTGPRRRGGAVHVDLAIPVIAGHTGEDIERAVVGVG